MNLLGYLAEVVSVDLLQRQHKARKTYTQSTIKFKEI